MNFNNKVRTALAGFVIASMAGACNKSSDSPGAVNTSTAAAPDSSQAALSISSTADVTAISYFDSGMNPLSDSSITDLSHEFNGLDHCVSRLGSATRAVFYTNSAADKWSLDLYTGDSALMDIRDNAIADDASLAFLGSDTIASDEGQAQAQESIRTLRFSCTEVVKEEVKQEEEQQQQDQIQEPVKEEAKEEKTEEPKQEARVIFITLTLNQEEAKQEEAKQEEQKDKGEDKDQDQDQDQGQGQGQNQV